MTKRKMQLGFGVVEIVAVVVIIAIIGFVGYKFLSNGNAPVTVPFLTPADASLPNMSYWQSHKSDRFLVDMDVVQAGRPYMGLRSTESHPGAHVVFGDDYKSWPKNGNTPSDYPPIYAVADGLISHMDPTAPVGQNDKYNITLEIAKGINFDYSIEPFVKEPSAGFYKDFIKVKNGQQVKKGQIIAYMYLPHIDSGTHIHFDLSAMNGGQPQFMAPAIFSKEIVQNFHDHWGSFNNINGTLIPACMGYMLPASENPFGTGATDCLN